ncbi:MAG: DUF2851 family protein [Flammeovirgaceae bacterium]
MKEEFLHYVWKFQYFDKTALQTTCKQPVSIQHPGYQNFDAGPDFEQGKVKIEQLNWVGQIEIHYHSSDWFKHQHQLDLAYDNVILHVVWNDDQAVYRSDGSRIPTIELKHRVDPQLIEKFKQLIVSPHQIACAENFSDVSQLIQLSMLDKVLMERLDRKANEVLELLKVNQMDWEETTYQVLAKNFGFKINAFPFLLLSRGLPFKLLKKHGNQLFQLEALLFGQSGLINKYITSDHYHQKLSKEYRFLAHKYQLLSKQLTLAQWKFLRMRPANFPTIRVAQFAALHHQHQSFFSKLLHANSIEEFEQLFQVQQSAYWTSHYLFGKKSKKGIASLGQRSIQNILINSVVPLLVAYGKHRSEQHFIDRGIALLSSIKAESNAITKHWEKLSLPLKSAFDSQGAIEWYQEYCAKHKCLNCSIGVKLVR